VIPFPIANFAMEKLVPLVKPNEKRRKIGYKEFFA
jgi:hypothetical protein